MVQTQVICHQLTRHGQLLPIVKECTEEIRAMNLEEMEPELRPYYERKKKELLEYLMSLMTNNS
jgi:hypothetical protein